MERVTTFKLCFLLGVPEYKLRKDFPVEWRLASRIRYFDSMSAVLEYRDISLAYFAVLSRYKECSAEISMLHVLKDCGVSNISRVFPSSTESLLEFTNRLASRRNELLAAAYSVYLCRPFGCAVLNVFVKMESAAQLPAARGVPRGGVVGTGPQIYCDVSFPLEIRRHL